MAALRLAWLLVRRSTGIRRWGMVAAATIGVLVVTLVLALPDAYLTGDAVKADRLVLSIVGIFLLVPVGVLLLAVSRLSAATKDRRLATLRMLGLTPRRTRWVTALENGLLALAGRCGRGAGVSRREPAGVAAVDRGGRSAASAGSAGSAGCCGGGAGRGVDIGDLPRADQATGP